MENTTENANLTEELSTEVGKKSFDLDWHSIWPTYNEQDYYMPINDTMYSSDNYTYYSIDCMEGFREDSVLTTVYFRVTIFFMYFIIFCLALVGNGAVCFIVKATPKMRTVTNYFIANLAVGDILMCVFCVPFTFVSQLVLNYWPFGAFLCRLVNYSQAVSVLVSAYTLVALAADRCRAITQPLKPRLSTPTAYVVIAGVWIGALATAAPIPIVSALSTPSKWHALCERSICSEEWPTPEQEYYYSMALMGLQFVIPLAVLVCTYTRIAVVVWAVRPPGEAENSRDRRMAKSKRKMVKMMVVVVVVFTICWLPFNSIVVLWRESWELWAGMPYVWFAFHWLAMSHCCYNPIIYCYMNARFRVGFLQVLGKIPCCKNYAKSKLSYADTVNRSSMVAHIPLTGIEMSENVMFRKNTGTTFIHSMKKQPSTINNKVMTTSFKQGSLNNRQRVAARDHTQLRV